MYHDNFATQLISNLSQQERQLIEDVLNESLCNLVQSLQAFTLAAFKSAKICNFPIYFLVKH